LEDALLGVSSLPLFHFYSSALFSSLFATPADAFPESSEGMSAAVEECREKYNIVRAKDSKDALSLIELVA
jgi:hypothetical protein